MQWERPDFGRMTDAEACAVYQAAGWPVRRGDDGTVQLDLGTGYVALVCDDSGYQALEALVAAHGPHGLLTATPRIKGATWVARLFRLPKACPSAAHMHGAAQGVHLWGAGRSIALPPSTVDQIETRWHPQPADLKTLPILPSWLVDMARDPTTGHAAVARAAAPATGVALSDLGNAERIARLHGRDLRWVEAWGAWLVWTGVRWERDQTGEAVRRACDAVRQIGAEAATLDHHDQRKALLAHAIKSESAGKIAAALQLLRAQPGIAVTVDQLDADPWLLGCPNGTVDLRTGELRPAARADLITKLCGVPFDPEAAAPTWDAFLADVQPDDAVRAFIQRLAGYGATGVIREHVLPIHYGEGGNGKGVCSEALLAALGDYARQIPTDLLLTRNGEAHPTERATLWGCRLAAASELPSGRGLNEALVKQLTGGDTIAARFMGKDFFEFRPTHTLWVSTNHRPVIRESGNGIWRRVVLVPWTVTPPAPDTTLPNRVRDELSGVLRWIVEGCLAWQREGLAPPAAVQAATAEYRDESDVLGQFLAERTTAEAEYRGASVRAPASALYKAYQAWCLAGGIRPDTQTAFGRALGLRGFAPLKVGGGTVWRLGLRLRSDDAATIDPGEGCDGVTDGDGF